jgi:hypothetical protein
MQFIAKVFLDEMNQRLDLPGFESCGHASSQHVQHIVRPKE